jgi:hypothetical protein
MTKNGFKILAGIIAHKVINSIKLFLFSLAVRIPTSLINETESDRLAIAMFHNSQSLFNGHFNTSSVISVTLNGRHYANLSEPVIIWIMRNRTITSSKLLHLLKITIALYFNHRLI